MWLVLVRVLVSASKQHDDRRFVSISWLVSKWNSKFKKCQAKRPSDAVTTSFALGRVALKPSTNKYAVKACGSNKPTTDDRRQSFSKIGLIYWQDWQAFAGLVLPENTWTSISPHCKASSTSKWRNAQCVTLTFPAASLINRWTARFDQVISQLSPEGTEGTKPD